MKLNDFLSSLTSTSIQVTIVDLNTNTEITSMKASGYASLDEGILNREVKQWSVMSTTAIKVILESAETTTTEP